MIHPAVPIALGVVGLLAVFVATREPERVDPRALRRQQATRSLTRDELRVLASQVQTTEERLLLAIVAASEIDRESTRGELEAVVHAVLNRVDRRQRSVWREAIGTKLTTGPQSGRPFASGRVPSGDYLAALLEAVDQVLDDRRRGRTGDGVTHFIHTAAQRTIAGRGGLTPDQVDRARRAEGLVYVQPPGTSRDRMMAWKPRDAA